MLTERPYPHWAWAVLVCVALLWLRPAPGLAQEPTVPIAKDFVADSVGVIDANTRTALTRLIEELRQKTGAEIAVVVVATTQPLSAFEYAMQVAESWKPGSKDKDNGVVFLVAIEDREMFILTGYGVEGALPDGKVGAIRDQIVVPAFRNGDFAGGIAAATNEMARIIAADAGVELTGVLPLRQPQQIQLSTRAMVLLMLLALVAFFVIARNPVLAAMLLSSGRSSRRGPFGHHGTGGFGGGFGGGGFGGFGGGGFGGGGAGGRW